MNERNQAAPQPVQAVRDETVAPDKRDTTDARDTVNADARDTVNTDTRDTRDTNVAAETDEGFLPQERMENLRRQWNDIQARFVDDPRSAVQAAQQLVSELVNELTETFSRERGTLEGQWSQGGQADTEALRVALQRYRSFFNRLLRT